MTIEQYLAVLGLPPDANRQQIRDAYRRLIMIFHPDRNPAGASHFQIIRHAYECLMAAAVNDVEETMAASLDVVAESAPVAMLNQLHPGERRRARRRGTPEDRRFEFIVEDHYKGLNVRIQA